jgi:hypothetical protein
MGCNCGKRATPPPAETVVASGQLASQSFSFTPPSGPRQVFGSRLEAEAARVRAGGAGSIT